MADISKCSGIDCPLRLHCFRFVAKAGERQAYLVPTLVSENGVTYCEHYYELPSYYKNKPAKDGK